MKANKNPFNEAEDIHQVSHDSIFFNRLQNINLFYHPSTPEDKVMDLGMESDGREARQKGRYINRYKSHTLMHFYIH